MIVTLFYTTGTVTAVLTALDNNYKLGRSMHEGVWAGMGMGMGIEGTGMGMGKRL